MKIVHTPTNIAGQMGRLCAGIRETHARSVTVTGYNWFHSYLNYPQGGLISTDAYELANSIDSLIDYFDLFHFHNGHTWTVSQEDLPQIAGKGKKMIMHHWGSDVRTQRLHTRLNPYALPQGYMKDEEITKRLQRLAKYVKHAIVQDGELMPHIANYYEHVHVLPLCCNVREIRPHYPLSKPKTMRIVHAPTNRAVKGSDFIEMAMRQLSKQFPLEFITVQKQSHHEALRIYATADLIIDQVLSGTYGMLSVEAMALGKPTVAFIREDVSAALPLQLPIVNVHPDTLQPVLAELLSMPEKWRELGIAGRKYVEAVHDVRPVIAKLMSIYERI